MTISKLLPSLFDDDGNSDWALAQALFKAEVSDRASLVDPGNEHDWHSLTIGWAVAKGFDPEEAMNFATHIRYRTDLG